MEGSGWKKNTPAVGPAEQARLIRAGRLKAADALLQLRDADSGKEVLAHRGSVSWNAYRRRWVLIAVQSSGTSPLGEVWYSEADTPLGPWVYARKVLTHDRYSFYNPKQHPHFAKKGGRILFFEGTYTHTFSDSPDATPRYDYNQMMYKLDLADPRLALPVPVYQRRKEPHILRHAARVASGAVRLSRCLLRPRPTDCEHRCGVRGRRKAAGRQAGVHQEGPAKAAVSRAAGGPEDATGDRGDAV